LAQASFRSRVGAMAFLSCCHTPETTTLHDETVFDVSEAIESFGFGRFQVELLILAGSIWIADAMEMMLLSFLTPAVTCEWDLSDESKALLTTVVFCGMLIGAPFWGWFADRNGRRLGYFCSVLITAIAGLVSAISVSYSMLLVCRCIVGFGISGSHIAVTLFTEFMPNSWRAFGVILFGGFWSVGSIFEALLAWQVMPNTDPQLGWKLLLAISAIPLFVLMLFYPCLPESPRWDLANGNIDRAAATLQRAADRNGRELPPGKLNEAQSHHAKSTSFLSLCAPALRRTTVLLIPLWVAAALNYYGIVLLTTELFAEEKSGDRCGGKAITSSSESKSDAGCAALTDDDYRDTLLDTTAELPGLLVSIVLINWVGRKGYMGGSLIVFVAMFGLLVKCWDRSIENVILYVARASISSMFQVLYLYTPEVFPTVVRSKGLGLCAMMARIGGMTTPFIAETLMPISSYLALGSYAGMALIGAVAACCLTETTGKSMSDTIEELSTSTGYHGIGEDGASNGA